MAMLCRAMRYNKNILEGKGCGMKLKKVILGAFFALALVGMMGCNKEKKEDKYASKVTVGKYKGIEVEKMSTKPSKDDIEGQIKSYLYTLEDEKIKEVKDGDNVNIDFEGKIDGEAFDGGSSEGYDLLIGSNSFIDDFEEQLIGKKVGKTYDVKVTFPDDYAASKDLQGKDAVFEVKINYVSPRKLTDKLVKKDKSNECETVEEYETYIEEQLIEQLETTAESSIKSTILTKIVENSRYNEKNIKEDIAKEVKNSQKQIKEQYNMTVKQYAENIGTDEETLMGQIEESAKSYVKQSLALLVIAEKEDITLSDKEFNSKVQKEIDAYANSNYSFSKEDFYKQFG
jgi:trigger factor